MVFFFLSLQKTPDTDEDSPASCRLLTFSFFFFLPLPFALKSLPASRNTTPHCVLRTYFIVLLWAASFVWGLCQTIFPARVQSKHLALSTLLHEHPSFLFSSHENSHSRFFKTSYGFSNLRAASATFCIGRELGVQYASKLGLL